MKTKGTFLLAASVLFASVCVVTFGLLSQEPDRTILPAQEQLLGTLSLYEQLDVKHKTSMAPPDEPGTSLFVVGTLVRAQDGAPLATHRILFYQADHIGEYRETTPGIESTARLRGELVTDSQGRFFVQTVLPGDYGTRPDNRHIHTQVIRAHPDAYDFYFKQHINAGLASWANRSSQAFVLDLRRFDDTTLIAQVTLRARSVEPNEGD